MAAPSLSAGVRWADGMVYMKTLGEPRGDGRQAPSTAIGVRVGVALARPKLHQQSPPCTPLSTRAWLPYKLGGFFCGQGW